jgi:hypothetical protein
MSSNNAAESMRDSGTMPVVVPISPEKEEEEEQRNLRERIENRLRLDDPDIGLNLLKSKLTDIPQGMSSNGHTCSNNFKDCLVLTVSHCSRDTSVSLCVARYQYDNCFPT